LSFPGKLQSFIYLYQSVIISRSVLKELLMADRENFTVVMIANIV